MLVWDKLLFVIWTHCYSVFLSKKLISTTCYRVCYFDSVQACPLVYCLCMQHRVRPRLRLFCNCWCHKENKGTVILLRCWPHWHNPAVWLLPTWRCASMVLAMAVRPSVRLSQVGVLSKRPNRLIWILAHRLSFTYPTLCWKIVQVSPKIRVLSSGTLFQTLWTGKILQLHVDCCKCCQLRWTLSVINWRRSSVTSLSHWLSTLVDGRDVAHNGGLSDTCFSCR